MSLKILMLNKKKEELRKQYEEFENKEKDLLIKSEQLEKNIEEAESEEELELINEEVDKHTVELEEVNSKKKDLAEKIADIEKETEEVRKKIPKQEERKGVEKMDERNIIEKYIRRAEVSVKSTDIGVLIPKEILYVPKKEIETVADLSTLVTKTQVTTASGTYPVVKRSKAKLHTVAELEKNPELAKPEFINVEWTVDTFRGAIPVSEEAIQDSEVDVLNIIQVNAQEQKINTVNEKISEVLKGFTAKNVTNLDELKHILNVDLDAGYERKFIVSQSFFQIMDTLKDKNGKYILNDNISGTTNKTLLGYPLTVVNDNLLGNDGEAKAFIGDISQAVFFADRADIGVKWIDNTIYGQYLQVGIRFGVKKIDDKAGFFVTFNPATV